MEMIRPKRLIAEGQSLLTDLERVVMVYVCEFARPD